jgi:hypothetical protein
LRSVVVNLSAGVVERYLLKVWHGILSSLWEGLLPAKAAVLKARGLEVVDSVRNLSVWLRLAHRSNFERLILERH